MTPAGVRGAARCQPRLDTPAATAGHRERRVRRVRPARPARLGAPRRGRRHRRDHGHGRGRWRTRGRDAAGRRRTSPAASGRHRRGNGHAGVRTRQPALRHQRQPGPLPAAPVPGLGHSRPDHAAGLRGNAVLRSARQRPRLAVAAAHRRRPGRPGLGHPGRLRKVGISRRLPGRHLQRERRRLPHRQRHRRPPVRHHPPPRGVRPAPRYPAGCCHRHRLCRSPARQALHLLWGSWRSDHAQSHVCPAQKADVGNTSGATGVVQATLDPEQRCVAAAAILRRPSSGSRMCGAARGRSGTTARGWS